MIGEQSGTVIGVVKDFLFGDISFGIPPAVFYLESENLDYMMIKYFSSDNFTSIRNLQRSSGVMLLLIFLLIFILWMIIFSNI